MPNCFQLFRKGSTEPEILQKVDEAICKHVGVPVDETYWCASWYNVVGFLIACKNDCSLGSEKLREEVDRWYDNYPEEERDDRRKAMRVILAFLEENYSSNAWVEIGKR